MSPLVIVVFVLLGAVAILLGALLWALDHMRAAWPYTSAPSRRQRRAWAKERKRRLPFARVVERSVRRG